MNAAPADDWSQDQADSKSHRIRSLPLPDGAQRFFWAPAHYWCACLRHFNLPRNADFRPNISHCGRALGPYLTGTCTTPSNPPRRLTTGETAFRPVGSLHKRRPFESRPAITTEITPQGTKHCAGHAARQTPRGIFRPISQRATSGYHLTRHHGRQILRR